MGDIKQFADVGEMLVHHGREEGFVQGREQGRVEGWEEGRAEGDRNALLFILAKRFGSLPLEAVQCVDRAPPGRIAGWLAQALDAPGLDSLLGDARQ